VGQGGTSITPVPTGAKARTGARLYHRPVSQARPKPYPAPSEPEDPARRIVPTREGYDLWAGHYDDDANPLVVLEEPIVAAALGEVRGLRILDVGCGTGRHAARLAGAGAQVTAIDFSQEMLAKARAKPGADRVRFIRHDLSKPLPLPSEAFDRVICCLVLDHIAALDMLFAEMARVCVGGSDRARVLITSMHPAMMLKGVQARFTDPASGEKVHVASVPNQISNYVMAAVNAGLAIDSMREFAADQTLARLAPRAGKYLGWPMLLVMELRPGG
jgi:ubiquinone/menaquinone biosynthesis C-methylase UbiE